MSKINDLLKNSDYSLTIFTPAEVQWLEEVKGICCIACKTVFVKSAIDFLMGSFNHFAVK